MLDTLRQGQPFAVVDLGSAYAKALILALGPAPAWSVVGASAVCYTSRQERAAPAPLADRLQAAAQALEQARDRTPSLCGRVLAPSFLVLTAPEASGQLAHYRLEVARPTPGRPIEESEARSAATSAHAACLGSAAAAGLAWAGHVWQASFVDGRGVTGATGFRGATLAVESTQALVRSEDVAAARAWAMAVAPHTLMVPESAGIAELLRRQPACLLLDAGAQRTDLYLRPTDGSLRHLRLPLGGHFFGRWLALAAGISPSRAERVKIAYAGGRLNPHSVARVRAVMRRALRAYARRFGDAFAAGDATLPGAWLTCGGASSLPDMALLPGALPDASMARLERSPSLAPFCLPDAPGLVIAGPERLQPCHAVALGLAQYVVRLSRDAAAAREACQIASLANKAGLEVASEWLSL